MMHVCLFFEPFQQCHIRSMCTVQSLQLCVALRGITSRFFLADTWHDDPGMKEYSRLLALV